MKKNPGRKAKRQHQREEYGGQPRCVELDDFCSHGVRRTDEID